jgi:hypothetical protein
VWREHLRPWLSVESAAGLRGACKALKGLVREWPVRLRMMEVGDLEPALTCFPTAGSLNLGFQKPLEAAEESRMVEVLRGHGGTLKRVEAKERSGRRLLPPAVGGQRLLSSAVRAGALPDLTHFHFSLGDRVHREILSGGMLPHLEEVEVNVDYGAGAEQLALLEPLRHLTRLRRLELRCCVTQEAAFPPFIPPSLKTLGLTIGPQPLLESLLRDLPSMLQASGARLEVFGLLLTTELREAAGLAQVLRLCSSTLKTLKLEELMIRKQSPPFLHASMVGLMSCCATLEVLHCPWEVFSALPAACPTFPRLTELRLVGMMDVDDDVVWASPAWEIMASGRLPALASAYIRIRRDLLLGRVADGEGARERVPQVARAFEAVAGTLRRLSLTTYADYTSPTNEACYELGASTWWYCDASGTSCFGSSPTGGTTMPWAGEWPPPGAAPSCLRSTCARSERTSTGSLMSPVRSCQACGFSRSMSFALPRRRR